MGQIVVRDTSPTPEITELDFDDRIDMMIDWFRANFEDALPLRDQDDDDDRDVTYFGDEPFDADEQLKIAFDEDLYPEEITEATRLLEDEGTWRWTAASHRVFVEYEEGDEEEEGGYRIEQGGAEDGLSEGASIRLPSDGPSLEERIKALSGQLGALERHIDEWRNVGVAIGHNCPPPDKRLMISAAELDEAQQSIDDVRTELRRPDPISSANVETLIRAESALRKIRRKLLGWLKICSGIMAGGIAGNFATEAMLRPQEFYTQIQEVSQTLTDWIAVLV